MLMVNYDEGLKVIDFKEFLSKLRNDIYYMEESKLIIPDRTILRLNQLEAVWLLMPIADMAKNKILFKTVSEYKKNVYKNLPKATGYSMLINLNTGEILGLFDSNLITGLRTGALNGLAVDILSRKDSSKLGVIGSGFEARWLTMFTLQVRDINEIKVYSPNPSHRKEFVNIFNSIVNTKDFENPKEVTNSDIIITATNSKDPVLYGDWIREGTHISSIGTLPDRRELDVSVIKRANLIVADYKKFVVKEAGDILYALNNSVINYEKILELNDIIKGKISVKRSNEDITLYKSVGYAFLDLVAAEYLYEKFSKT
ncbi:MAG: ornithine cyclodeaminase family protein [Sulfolobus sp.]